MRTYHAERLLDADRTAVHATILDLVVELWGANSRLVTDDPRCGYLHAVAASPDDEEVWLCWELTPVAGVTKVGLTMDDLDTGPDMTDDLHAVLDLLTSRVAGAVHGNP